MPLSDHPPPETRGYCCGGLDVGFPTDMLFYFGWSAGRTGWRAAGHGGRAGGRGPRGDEQVRQKMDRQNYISRLSDADRLHTLELSFTAFEVWRPDLSSYQILVPIGYRATALSDASVCLSVTLPPTGNPWVCLEGGWTWVGQQTCLFSFAWSAGRTGWRAAAHGRGAGVGGAHGGASK